jgi:ketosteroid isomerase-like protein
VQRSTELEGLVSDWFAAASKGDASLVARHVSDDPANRLVGSDPDEWIQGPEVARFLSGEAERSGGKVTFTPREIEAFEEGSVGWAATKLRITLSDGASVSPRWTAVFRKEDGVWRFVQTHASIAVTNDEIGWVYADPE